MSDTHVGFAAYNRVTPEGLNAREQDFFDAFRRAIDVAIEKKVDVVLHSGDLFDSVRPTNRALHHVMEQAHRLRDARIPLVVVGGNHEAPRLRETGAVLRLLEFVPGAKAVYKAKTEIVRVGDLAIHATPHATDNEALLAQLREVKPLPDARYNVASLHAGVMGVADFRTGEFHEQVVPQNEIPKGMDYVALGHYHRAVEVAPKVWYAGSTERCSFKECGEEKSVNLVDLARGTVTPIPLQTRPMRMLPLVACEGLDDAAAAGAIYDALAGADINGAIARLRVTGLAAHVHATLDFKRIKEMTAGAFHFDLAPELVRGASQGVASAALGDLADEFEGFLSQRPIASSERDAILAEAKALLAGAAEGA